MTNQKMAAYPSLKKTGLAPPISVTASFHRVEELLGKLFEDKREARERAE